MAKSSPTATEKLVNSTTTLPNKHKPRLLPQYKTMLHKDASTHVEHVISTLILLCAFNKQDAELRTLEAHDTGCALLLITHKERAELYVDQFQSRSLTVTIEPAE